MSHLDTAFSRWLRAPRTSQSPAESAYALIVHKRRRDWAGVADYILAAGFAAVLVAIAWGAL